MASFSVPNMRSAVMAWASPTTVFVAAKKQKDYKTYETYYQYTLMLLRVPSGQALEFKKEGERAWNNETLYCDASIILGVDDIIYFKSTDSERFRIVNVMDYQRFGYMEYQIRSDWGG